MPAALSMPIGNRWYDWRYSSEPEPHMHGRRIAHARGKVLGGSSSINGMIFQRGNPLDYERWAADPGMQAWDYAHCLPYFKRMETCLAGADAWRGGDGPLRARARARPTNPLFDAFFAAAVQAGYPRPTTSTATGRKALRSSIATSTADGGSAPRAPTCIPSCIAATSPCARLRTSTRVDVRGLGARSASSTCRPEEGAVRSAPAK